MSSTNLGGLAGGPYAWLAYQGAWGEILGIPGFAGPQGPAASPEHKWYLGRPLFMV